MGAEPVGVDMEPLTLDWVGDLMAFAVADAAPVVVHQSDGAADMDAMH